MPDDPIDVSQAYLHFGRHTEAGKMIFALYSAKQNRRAYKPDLKFRTKTNVLDPHEQHLQSLKRTPKRVAVKVPKPIKRKGEEEEPRFPIYGGRRPADLILKETQDQLSKQRMQLPRSIARKPRSDVIAELQKKFSGESQSDDNHRAERDQTAYETKESLNEALVSQLHQEIGERKQFLQQMKSLDKKTYERISPSIQAEIRQRMGEIQELSEHER